MKKGIIIVIVVILLIAAIAGGLYFYNAQNGDVVTDEVTNQGTEENVENVVTSAGTKLELATAEDMTKFVDGLYEGIEIYPSITTMELSLEDMDAVTYNTGLTKADDIESIVISEPMVSQAYSLVLVKVKEGADADSIAKEMSEKINPRKWICVSAEKIYATSSENFAFLVMTNTDLTDSVSNAFKSKVEKIGKEYIVDNSQEEVVLEDM